MPQDEIIIFRYQQQSVHGCVLDNSSVGRLTAKDFSDMRSFMALLNKPAAQRWRQLRVDKEMHQAA